MSDVPPGAVTDSVLTVRGLETQPSVTVDPLDWRAQDDLPAVSTAYMEAFTVSLFDALVAQAREQVSTPRPDTRALDRLISFPGGEVGVQVKSSYTHDFNKRGYLKFPVEQGWVDNWRSKLIPPRLVLFLLPRSPRSWTQQRGLGVWYRAPAYWAMLDASVSVPSVTVLRQSRFTVDTIRQWGREVTRATGGGV